MRCAIKVESNDRDPCGKIVSRFHERGRTSFPSRLWREESANFSLCLYILTNVHHEVLYIGVTSDLFTRIPEHITKVYQIHSPQNIIATSLFIMRHVAE
jgi:hypothetical protein